MFLFVKIVNLYLIDYRLFCIFPKIRFILVIWEMSRKKKKFKIKPVNKAPQSSPAAKILQGKNLLFYQDGKKFFFQGDIKAALREWMKIPGQARPNDLVPFLAEAYFRNSVSLYHDANFPSENILSTIISQLSQAVSLQPQKAIYHFHLGLSFQHLKNFKKARAAFRKAVELEPNNERFLLHLVLSYIRSDLPQTEIPFLKDEKQSFAAEIFSLLIGLKKGESSHFEKNDEISLGNSAVNLLYGLFLFKNGDFEQAKKAFVKSLENMSANDSTSKALFHYFLGLTFYKLQDLQQGNKYWKLAAKNLTVAKHFSTNLINFCQKEGVAAFRSGDLAGAKKWFETVSLLNPSVKAAQKNLQHVCFLQANELAQNDEWEEALRIWQNACSRDDLNVFYNIALAYDKLEDPSRANLHWQKIIAYYEEICRNHPDDMLKKEYLGVAYQHLIKNYQDIDEDKRAIRTMEKLCKLKPEDTTCQFELAETYLDNEKWNSAHQQFLKILSQDPKNVDALVNLAFVQDMQYKEQQAIQTLEKALQIDPDSVEAKHQLAALFNEEARECLHSDDYRKAGELFKKQIKLEPSDFSGYYGLGYIYSEYLDNLKMMELIFQGYISTNPGNAEVYIEVADACIQFKHPKKAASYYQKAEKLADGDPEIFVNIGRLAFNSSERQAEKFFKKAIELAPYDADIYFQIALSYSRRSPWKARKYLAQCLKININYYQAHVELAHLEAMEGKQVAARKQLLLAKQIVKSAEKEEELAAIENLEKVIGKQMDFLSELQLEDE